MIFATAKSTKTSGMITADINGRVVAVICDREFTPAINDVILVDKIGSQWVAFGRTDTAAPTPPDGNEAPPPVQPTSGSTTIAPVETRSYRNSFSVGWRFDDDDVYQGQYGGYGNHIGVAFYGSKPRALDGATVTGAKFRVRMHQIGSYPPQAATMWLVTQTVRPGGAPTLTSSTTGPRLAQGETFDGFAVPTAWAQAMVDGTAGGLGFYVATGNPYLRMAGRGRWSPAFTLTINWRR